MKIRTAFCIAILVPLSAVAAPDAAKGRGLVDRHKCETCHQDKVYGPPGTIYLRKDRKVTSWAKLKAQVAACNTQLNAGLFPEDEEDVAAFLDATYYRFSTK